MVAPFSACRHTVREPEFLYHSLVHARNNHLSKKWSAGWPLLHFKKGHNDQGGGWRMSILGLCCACLRVRVLLFVRTCMVLHGKAPPPCFSKAPPL